MPSANKTANIKLNQWQSNEYNKMEDFNADNLAIDNKFTQVDNTLTQINNNFTQVNNTITYETAGGTGTALTVILPATLTNGYAKTFVASANNSAGATTINGKPLYKPNTTIAPNLVAGKAYTVWYNSTNNCFFIKASAEGDADVFHVLATKKFSNDNDTGLVGTMANNNVPSTALAINGSYTIPGGYHPGTEVVTQSITAKSAQTYTPSTVTQTIASGQYLSGVQTISGDANLVTANIRAGTSIFGVAGNSNVVNTAGANLVAGYMRAGASGYNNGALINGSMPNYVGVNQAGTQAGVGNSGIIYINPPNGYWESSNAYIQDGNFAAANIVSGKSIFGLGGSATIVSLGGQPYATGSTYHTVLNVNTITLPFTPRAVYLTLSGTFQCGSWGGAFRNQTGSLMGANTISISSNIITLGNSNTLNSGTYSYYAWA